MISFGKSAETRPVDFPEVPIHRKVRLPRNTSDLVFKKYFLKNSIPDQAGVVFF